MHTPPSILVVDDDPNNFDVIETLLHAEGYDLHYASNGLTALEQLDAAQPDVILLDVMMPDMDGIEVCQRIKAIPQWKSVSIIMVTALTAKEDLAVCLAAGASDFISKPINRVELQARVRSMLTLKQQYDELQALLKFREDMVHMLVHDLRNPLSSIILSTSLLMRVNLPPEKQQQKVEQIAFAAQHLQTLIDSLLLMAKLESGRMLLNYSRVDLKQLCQVAIADMQAIAAQKNVQFLMQLPAEDCWIKVDAAIFRRILDNLLSNAIKYSICGSQVVVRVEEKAGNIVCLQVKDDGIGIRQEFRQQIFEKYEVGTLLKDVDQIGLGLAFCKLAIEAHNGSIIVEDNQPKGAIFTILLPLLDRESSWNADTP